MGFVFLLNVYVCLLSFLVPGNWICENNKYLQLASLSKVNQIKVNLKTDVRTFVP